MGKIANTLAKKFNLRNANEFATALAELNSEYDKNILPPISSTPPTIIFANKSKAVTSQNEAELIYPTTETFDEMFTFNFASEVLTHPQINGLINAKGSTRGSNLVITTTFADAPRIQQKEELFITNVLQMAWAKFIIGRQRSITQSNVENESERQQELQALNFLKP